MASFKIETKYFRQGVKYIAGIDEAGRGALFGPVVAAAVIFPPRFYGPDKPGWVAEIDDSKALSPPKRKWLQSLILKEAMAVGVGTASAREIDAFNIHRATLLAMSRALARLSVKPELVLIDGAQHYLTQISIPQVSFNKGDRLCCSVAAASIIAKVFRDDLIDKLDRVFKGYDLCHNKGYGTKKHKQALEERGPTPLHRQSFKLKY